MGWPFAAATRWPQPDFLPRAQRPPPLAWAALLCASLALAFAVDDWVVLEAARADLRAQAERARPAEPRAGARPALGGPSTAGAAEEAQAIARGLAHPWRTLFESSERHAAVGVRWLRLEHDAERSDVRLAGVAPDRHDAVKTLEALAADPQWQDVLLLRIESARAGEAGDAVLFELRARLAGIAAADAARGAR